MSKKKMILFGAAAIAVILTGAVYIIYPHTQILPNNKGGLSKRASEYLAVRSQEDQSWKTVRLADETQPGKKIVTDTAIKVGTCFSVVIPLHVANTKNKGKCFMVFSTEEPKGNIRIYEHETEYADINDVSDLKMRRMFKEKYTEREIIKEGAVVYSFEAADPLLYDAVTFYLHNRRLIIISMQFPTSENLDTIMNKLVQSIKVL